MPEKEGSQEKIEQNESENAYKAEEISPVEQPTSDDQEKGQLEPQEEEEIEEESIQGKGCLRGCLTPVMIFFGIVLILIMAIYMRRNSIEDFILKRIVVNTQKNVLMVLPEDMGKDEIDTVFENVKTALKEKKIDEENLAKVISDYHDAMEKGLSTDGKKKEIDKLIEGLNSSIITSGQQS